jgi:hypothetical protein
MWNIAVFTLADILVVIVMGAVLGWQLYDLVLDIQQSREEKRLNKLFPPPQRRGK